MQVDEADQFTESPQVQVHVFAKLLAAPQVHVHEFVKTQKAPQVQVQEVEVMNQEAQQVIRPTDGSRLCLRMLEATH